MNEAVMKSWKKSVLYGLSVLLIVSVLFVYPPVQESAVVEAAGMNLLANPGIEAGTAAGWNSMGEAALTAVSDIKYAGSYSLRVTGRQAAWNGVGQSILSAVQTGKTYDVLIRVRMENVTSDTAKLTLRKVEGGTTSYTTLAQTSVTNKDWSELRGSFAYNPTAAVSDMFLYIEGPVATASFYIDEGEMSERIPNSWKLEANARIEQIRKRNAEIQVLDSNGAPVSQAQVAVRQKKHYFGFGSAINKNVLTNANYANFFKSNFEWAVHENESKWYANESSSGNVNYSDADQILAWTEANDIISRGHTLVWEVEQFQPSWVKSLTGTALQSALDNRLSSAVNHFKGKYVHWDVNNEMLHGSFYKDRLGASIWSYMYKRARELDSSVELFVNDYNVIEYAEDTAYKQQIQSLINEGAPIDGIGAQGHFGATVDPVSVKQRLDNLAQLGLPIWISEYDSTQPDVNLRADNLEALYRIAFSHPAVEGIMMWGFWEGSHWRANAHIVNNDWTLNEAGKRYQALLKEWTTSVDGTTNSQGAYGFRGFHGMYEVTITVPGASAVTKSFELIPGEATYPVIVTMNTSGNNGGGNPTIPAAPTGLTAVAGDAQVKLNWTSVAGASTYTVKRTDGDNNAYANVAVGLTSTSYTDTLVTNGKTYQYVVSASNTAGESMNSAAVTAKPISVGPGGNVSLVAQYKVGDSNATDNQIKPHMKIMNTGVTAVNLSDLKLRYYFTKDGTQAMNAWIDWAQIGGSNISVTFGSSSGANADTYAELSFNAGAGSLAAGASTGDIQLRMSKVDWSNFNENNDYSWASSNSGYTDWSKITLYVNGVLVWGSEPQ